jgi:adenine-specific DNA-methyltransferase
LFSFLDEYNFTIDERSPDDADIAIDPEMLGHIFENLLEDNKDKGAYYTPDHIVHYMCQESLAQYLCTALNAPEQKITLGKLVRKQELAEGVESSWASQNAPKVAKALLDVKICDPAIGSGAFPMGLLKEIYTCLLWLYQRQPEALGKLPLFSNGWQPAKVKLQIMQHCIYGVDIDKGAVDIARLRFWLSLIIEETQPQPLPNLDYKIMQGNSLLERYQNIDLSVLPNEGKGPKGKLAGNHLEDAQLDIYGKPKNAQTTMFGGGESTKQAFSEADKETLRELAQNYFKPEKAEQKATLKKQIDELVSKRIQAKIEEEILAKKKQEARLEEKLALLVNAEPKSRAQKTKNEKALAELQKKLFGTQNAQKRLAEQQIEILGLMQKEERPFFLWHLYFQEVFDENGGFDIVIGNPPYVRQELIKGKKELAGYETYSGTADLYVFFVEKSFDLMRKGGVFSFIMPNKWMQTSYGKKLRIFLLENTVKQLVDFGDLQVFEGATTYPCLLFAHKGKSQEVFEALKMETLDFENDLTEYIQDNLAPYDISHFSEETWMVFTPQEKELFESILRDTVSLEEYVDGGAHYGIKTGLSEAFLIDGERKDKLVKEDKYAEEIIVPFLQGRDIQPYIANETKSYLIKIPKGFTDEYSYESNKKPSEWIESSYPSIYKHLSPFEVKARKRSDKGDYWWELRACDYYKEFEKPKLMYQIFQTKPCFIYDDIGLFSNNSTWIIPKDDKLLLAILNSKMGWFLISKYCTAIQNGYQLIWAYFKNIPIPQEIPESTQSRFTQKVNQVLSAKRSGEPTEVLEAELDVWVYRLYRLNYEEACLVEPALSERMSESEYEYGE